MTNLKTDQQELAEITANDAKADSLKYPSSKAINELKSTEPAPKASRRRQQYLTSVTDGMIMDGIISLFGTMPYKNYMNNRTILDGKIISDTDISKLRVWCDTMTDKLNEGTGRYEKEMPRTGKDRICDSIETIADQNGIHPFKDFVESAAWDGTDHIQLLFETLILTDDGKKYKPHLELCFKKFFVNLVRKVYLADVRNHVLVFHGDQGIGKSRWIEKLLPVPEAFSEGQVDPAKPDCLAYHAEYILWHIAELDSVTSKKDAAELKDYVEKNTVTFRRPYDKYSKTTKSQLSFVASVNTNDFLRDSTGSRRFIVIPVKSINFEPQINYQQVFAQSKSLMENNFPSYLTKEDEQTQNIINSYFSADSLSELIIEKIESGGENEWLSVSELKSLCATKFNMTILNQVNLSDLRNRLSRLGFRTSRTGHGAIKFNVRLKTSIKS